MLGMGATPSRPARERSKRRGCRGPRSPGGGDGPTLLQVDAEGHEASVLRGAGRVLRQAALLAVIMEDWGRTRAAFGAAILRSRGLVASPTTPWRRVLTDGDADRDRSRANTVWVRGDSVVRERLRSELPTRIFGLAL
jgi:hypothetical protein